MAIHDANHLQNLVDDFASSEIGQTEAFRASTLNAEYAGTQFSGHRFADRSYRAWQKLQAIGDSGREALCMLFTHPRADVRVSAAAHLLRFRSHDAIEVLRMEAEKGQGLASFCAAQCIKNWKNGEWHLDPDPAIEQKRKALHEAHGSGVYFMSAGRPEFVVNTASPVENDLDRAKIDQFVEALHIAHGMVMNGGVLNAVHDVLSREQLESAIAGYRFVGLAAAADLFLQAEALFRDETRLDNATRDAYYAELELWESKLDFEYARIIPDDHFLIDTIERRLVPTTAAQIIEDLLDDFAASVIAETEVTHLADSAAAKRYADRWAMSFQELHSLGDAGYRALMRWLKYWRADVRVAAATCLLQYSPDEALAVLEAEGTS